MLATLVVIGALALGAGAAAGQSASDDSAVISGTVRLATPGAELVPTVAELVIDREGSDEFERLETDVAADGTFAFEVEANPSTTYFAVVRYEGITYLSNPLLVGPGFPTAEVDFEVFALSSVLPALSIESTSVTVLAIDREAAELTLVREDRVRQPDPVVYTGDEAGVTVRLPVPDQTEDAGGLDPDETYQFDGGTVAVTTALRPGVTSIVTRYTVRYDAAEDRYRLRVTSPLPADEMEIRVPQRFLREVEVASDDATRGTDDEFEGEPLTVIERTTAAGPGQGLVADLIGLSGVERASHPLTSGWGAAIGALLALVIVTGGTVVLTQRRGAAR